MTETPVGLVTALPAEAKPLNGHYSLIRDNSVKHTPLYRNGTMTLVVSGVGKKAAYDATSRLAELLGDIQAIWINLGIAGHPSRVIGEAVRRWDTDARVAVIASGGLSHFVVDEAFDRDILEAMARNDFEHLLSYDEGYYQAGSSEIKSWIAAGGAMQGAGLKGEIIDYQPLYRTPAGTGSSAAFVAWR